MYNLEYKFNMEKKSCLVHCGERTKVVKADVSEGNEVAQFKEAVRQAFKIGTETVVLQV